MSIIDDEFKKNKNTFIFLKISDFIKENLKEQNNLFIQDINIYIYNTKLLLKTYNQDIVKKSIDRMKNNYYNDENNKDLNFQENCVKKLLQYYKILKIWKNKINKN